MCLDARQHRVFFKSYCFVFCWDWSWRADTIKVNHEERKSASSDPLFMFHQFFFFFTFLMLVVDTAQLYTHSWRLFLFFKRHIKRLCLLEGLHSVGYYRHKKIELWEISLADKEKRTKEPRVELTKRELLISVCVWGGELAVWRRRKKKRHFFFFFSNLKSCLLLLRNVCWGGERER